MGIRKITKRLIVKKIPKSIISEIQKPVLELMERRLKVNEFLNPSFSLEGEDLVLFNLQKNIKNGFYVDVGAHHPFRMSNTLKFYQQGWQGINIDPLPGSMKIFDEERPNDINLEIAIMNDFQKELIYYAFDEPAYNTFSENVAKKIKEVGVKIIEELKIMPMKLSDVLDKYLPPQQLINFLAIDVEGMELEVLKSNDWEKYLPNFILIESLGTKIEDDIKSFSSNYLYTYGYQLISKLPNSIIYKLQVIS